MAGCPILMNRGLTVITKTSGQGMELVVSPPTLGSFSGWDRTNQVQVQGAQQSRSRGRSDDHGGLRVPGMDFLQTQQFRQRARADARTREVRDGGAAAGRGGRLSRRCTELGRLHPHGGNGGLTAASHRAQAIAGGW